MKPFLKFKIYLPSSNFCSHEESQLRFESMGSPPRRNPDHSDNDQVHCYAIAFRYQYFGENKVKPRTY